MKKVESIELDEINGKIVVTTKKLIGLNDKEGMKETKKKLRTELEGIVRQVKNLKSRAEEIKTILSKLEEAESVNSASVTEELQSSPVEEEKAESISSSP